MRVLIGPRQGPDIPYNPRPLSFEPSVLSPGSKVCLLYLLRKDESLGTSSIGRGWIRCRNPTTHCKDLDTQAYELIPGAKGKSTI